MEEGDLEVNHRVDRVFGGSVVCAERKTMRVTATNAETGILIMV